MQNRPKGHRASTFSTVKRAHSPFRKLLHPDRTKEKEVYKPPEGPRPSRPPLPPRSPYVEDESLHNLQHKLQDISTIGYKNPGVSQHQHRSLPPLPPRSAYVEDDPIQELQDKLVCLDNSSSPPPEDPYQYYPTVTAANTVVVDHIEPVETVTTVKDNISLVEITELPDAPLPQQQSHDTPQYRGATNPPFSDHSYDDFVSGLHSPQVIPHPPQLFASPFPPPHQLQNSALNLFPYHQHPHQPLLPPTNLLSPHHRRAHSLYSHGHSLADQILGESDLPGINRSLSFGMRGMGGVRGTRFSTAGSAVRTNINEHIEILNQHKSSIMNLLKEDFP